MGIRFIRCRAPTRIDLAGGTLDIWPIYLFLKEPTTINLAIDLFAEATLEVTPSEQTQAPTLQIQSKDQNLTLSFPWTELDKQSQIPPGLELHFKLLRYFVHKYREHLLPQESGTPAGAPLRPLPSLTLSTQAKSPAGAGLGGSSTLSIAMIGALATWFHDWVGLAPLTPSTDGENFIEIVRDVETTVIQVPAGMQDYYAAMFGGLQVLKWGEGTHTRRHLSSKDAKHLEDRILLFYSGQSRNSGINNWQLFKDFIDKKQSTREHFQKIADATIALENALTLGNWSQVGQTIHDEWETRKLLAAGITTSEMDQAFLLAKSTANTSGKVCGAGGGGCFFIYLADQTLSDDELRKTREQLRKKITSLGIRHLEFRSVPHGLDIQVERA